jgi:hypothetical protein
MIADDVIFYLSFSFKSEEEERRDDDWPFALFPPFVGFFAFFLVPLALLVMIRTRRTFCGKLSGPHFILPLSLTHSLTPVSVLTDKRFLPKQDGWKPQMMKSSIYTDLWFFVLFRRPQLETKSCVRLGCGV